MKAVILVAGYAKRLGELAKNRAKALLPIGGRPVIDYIIDQLEEIQELDGVVLVSNNRFYEQFTEYAKDRKTRLALTVLNDMSDSDDNKLGAIGDLQFAIEKENLDDDLLVLAGDNYFTYSIKAFNDFCKERNCDAICAKRIDNINDLRRMAVAKIDENAKITHLVEKPAEPESNIAVYATYRYSKDTARLVKKYLDEGNDPDAPGNFPAWLYKRQDVYLYIFDGECYDIGTPESYYMVDELLTK